MNMFRQLSEQEHAEFKACARATYKPLSEIKGIWHPVVQAECVRMNCEFTQTTPPELPSDLKAELVAAIEKLLGLAGVSPYSPASLSEIELEVEERAAVDAARAALERAKAPAITAPVNAELLGALETAVKWLRAIRSEANEALVIETAPDGASLCEMEGLIAKAKGQP
jgi:hypothetical protein